MINGIIRQMENKDEQLLTVVIPLFNEAENLPTFALAVIEFCRARNWDVIFVNDGSLDDTKKILDGLEHATHVRVVHHKVNRGYGGALKTGIRRVTTPYLVTMDGDGQHHLEDVERLFQFAVQMDADMVVGKREGVNISTGYRALGKYLIRSFTKILMPLPVSDLNSGFKLYRTAPAKRYITVCPDTMAFSDVITLVFLSEKNLVLEHPIRISPRKLGQSTINAFTAFETVMQVLNIALMFNPLRLFLPISIFCILAGIVWGVPIVLLGRGVSVGAMLAIVTGLLFFVLGLLASQLSSIRMERLRDQNSVSNHDEARF
jgi:glycosyltransferase involved in cell wall biosynthesis